MPVRILLVDDHEVVRIGLRALLERQDGLEVLGEAASAEEAVEQAARLKPDVVIMDIRMPGGSGVDACRRILARDPRTKVIILTSYADDEALFQSIAAGAAGYVLKQIGSDDLVHAVRAVSRGEALLDPSVTRRVLDRVRAINARADARRGLDQLTDQEQRILDLIGEGLTNKEIAREIYLSEKTVRNYVSSILAKLNLHNRAQAAAYAARQNQVQE